jgi:hypothetical protein
MTVTLSDGTAVSLPAGPDAAPSRAILQVLHRTASPVYIRAADGVATDVRAPRVGRVTSVESHMPARLIVDVEGTPERLVLDGHRPDETRLLLDSLASGVPLAVTSARQRIVTVRPMPAPAVDVTEAAPEVVPPDRVQPKVWDAITQMDAGTARDHFKRIVRLNCKGTLAHDHDRCIPFQYSIAFCFARAHAVCESLRDQGVTAGKLWIAGALRLDTRNDPEDCREEWTLHVAAFVRAPSPSTSIFVFDPSVSLTRTLSADSWKKAVHGLDADEAITLMDQQLLSNALRPLPVERSFSHDSLVLARSEFLTQCRETGRPPYVCTPQPAPDLETLPI